MELRATSILLVINNIIKKRLTTKPHGFQKVNKVVCYGYGHANDAII